MRFYYSVVALLIFAFLAIPAVADTAYVYTGSHYDNYTACYNFGCTGPLGDWSPSGLSGYFTLDSPLDPNLTMAQVFPQFFSFSDGVRTLTPDNSEIAKYTGRAATGWTFLLTTDASGNIVLWNIEIGSYMSWPYQSWWYYHSCNPASSPYGITSSSTAASSQDTSQCLHTTYLPPTYGELAGVTEYASVAGSPGTWERVNNVPEPATGLLALAGLLGLLKAQKKSGSHKVVVPK